MGDSKRPFHLLLLCGVLAAFTWPSAAEAASPVPLGRAASDPPELAVSFEEAAVVAGELTPGGDAVFWSVAREPQGAFNRVVRRAGLSVVDALGEARFDVEAGPVPLKSVWLIGDIATGAFAVAAPPGFELRRLPFPTRPFEVGAPGVVNRFRHPFDQLHFLVLRPGVGAWELETWDRASEDHDGADDDRVTTALEDLAPLEAAGPGPPEEFQEGDVLAVIHPRTLEVFAVRIGAPPGGGSGGGGE